jgi:hypothetical protein
MRATLHIDLENKHPNLTYKDFESSFKYFGESGTEISKFKNALESGIYGSPFYRAYNVIKPSETKTLVFAIKVSPQTNQIKAELIGAECASQTSIRDN